MSYSRQHGRMNKSLKHGWMLSLSLYQRKAIYIVVITGEEYALLEVVGKAMARIIQSKLQGLTEKILLNLNVDSEEAIAART